MKKYKVEGTEITYAEMVKDAINTIVAQHTSSKIINFALNVFPSPEKCTEEYHVEGVQLDSQILCDAASGYMDAMSANLAPSVPFASEITMDTVAAIEQVLNNVGNCGGTPMSKSLQWAKAYLDSLTLENDTYVLLATDGAPGCNSALDITTCESASVGLEPLAPEMCLDADESARAVYELARAGHKTFVIGVGKDVEAFTDVTNYIAYWGDNAPDLPPADFTVIPAPPAGDNWYYPAGDAETVNAALEDIINEAISCVFEVNWDEVPDVDPATDFVITKSCSTARTFGLPEDGKVEITYMDNCSDENPEAENKSMRIGWTWEELEGTSWDDIQAMEKDNVSGCRKIKLCENACNKLKTKKGVKEWEGVSASFGCKPFIMPE